MSKLEVYPEISKVKNGKFKCATTGRYLCDECLSNINRGDIIRTVDVKFSDGSKDRYIFDSKECREKFCKKNLNIYI